MTTVYQPPVQDIRFVLDLLGAQNQLQQLPAFTDIDDDLIDQIISEAGRFAQNILFPLNAIGDRQGAKFDNGEVKTPEGFASAYRQFQEAGWPSLSFDPAYGGQGLPQALNIIVFELLGAANHAWTMYPALLSGAYLCLHQFASEDIKKTWLPKLVSGESLPTMCLTEAHAGSDLGLLRTRAVPSDDGSYQITGNKIFISGGEQDLTENIIHLVLARLPDAPEGSRGISLFLVPKYLPNEGGKAIKNQVICTGIEEKMGINGSATCSLSFEDAKGWLIGEPNRGLAAMFVMMNSARLLVGVQGIGTAETAWQSSLAYAQERLQMRAPVRPPKHNNEAADPIIYHPAMQRLLMNQKASLEGMRMLTYWAALHLDRQKDDPNPQHQKESGQFLALLTPVIKTLSTEQSFLGASDALQIYGGHGFITETGIDQYMRDSRIALIYEGTNEIQAIDLLLRKVLPDQGEVLRQFIDTVRQTCTACPDTYHRHAQLLMALCDSLISLVENINKQAVHDVQLPYRIASEFLRLVGHMALAWLWLKAAIFSTEKHKENPSFYQGKIDTAAYYFSYLFPQTLQAQEIIKNTIEASETSESSTLLAHNINF